MVDIRSHWTPIWDFPITLSSWEIGFWSLLDVGDERGYIVITEGSPEPSWGRSAYCFPTDFGLVDGCEEGRWRGSLTAVEDIIVGHIAIVTLLQCPRNTATNDNN